MRRDAPRAAAAGSWTGGHGLPRSTTEATTPPASVKTYASRQHPDHY
ncbi:hypothetical protein [Mesorhizobium sp.]|nr:hypothetical protein [Mesorhizobium sp.]